MTTVGRYRLAVGRGGIVGAEGKKNLSSSFLSHDHITFDIKGGGKEGRVSFSTKHNNYK